MAAGVIGAAILAYVSWPSRGYVPRQEALEFHEREVQSIEAMTNESGRAPFALLGSGALPVKGGSLTAAEPLFNY